MLLSCRGFSKVGTRRLSNHETNRLQRDNIKSDFRITDTPIQSKECESVFHWQIWGILVQCAILYHIWWQMKSEYSSKMRKLTGNNCWTIDFLLLASSGRKPIWVLQRKIKENPTHFRSKQSKAKDVISKAASAMGFRCARNVKGSKHSDFTLRASL